MMRENPSHTESLAMDPPSTAYSFPSERAAREALAAVQGGARWSAPRRIARRMLYLDTVDWRVYRKGARLAVAWGADGTFVLWRAEPGAPFARRPIAAPPEFRWDVPFEDLHDQIGSVVDVRRLLPVVEVRLEGRVSRALDARDKTIAELVLERATVIRPDAPHERRKLAPTLRLVPVLGYPGPYDRLRAALDRVGGVRFDERCLLERALAALGIAPSGGAPKRSWTLHPDLRADEAMKTIFRVLYATMRDNEAGARANVDSEFLHDLRVAVRRTRSGLGQVRGVFRRPTVRRFKRVFSWLGEVTNPLRDLDVYLLSLPGYREWLAPEQRSALDPVERHLRDQHALAQRKLVAALESRRYRRECAAWSEFLASPAPARTTLPNARRPIVSVATERIGRAHARVMRRGSDIGPHSPTKDLHRLRIECKKLRYLLEFFADLYAGPEVDALIGALKKLQDNLGEHNDLNVHRTWLLDLEPRFDGPEHGATREAIRCVVGLIDERQAATRAEFHSRFDEFRAPDVERVFLRLFGDRCA
jgi:CHAD domain-containing protein